MDFPQLLSLSIMVFVLGLIPVAGVIISCIPLVLIAYSVGGFQDVVYILITVVIVHAIETYILNPKLMSSKTNLPVFYTFYYFDFLGNILWSVGANRRNSSLCILIRYFRSEKCRRLKKRTIFGRKKKVD